MSFDSLGLIKPLLTAVANAGYSTPTAIQQQAIPAIIKGQDVMAAAQTGTGKTAGFTLPLLQLLSESTQGQQRAIRALVLTPTRELAAQVAESVKTYGAQLPLKSLVVFGGVKINPQIRALQEGVDILIATPGRLLDLHGQKALSLKQVDILVLDEADRMLDMGFIHDIRKVMGLLPQKRQNLLFSATFSDEIKKLAGGFMHNPQLIEATPPNRAASTVKQWLYEVDKGKKPALLSHILRHNDWQQVLVFSRTKHGANRLVRKLEQDGISALPIHGNKSQAARTKALAEFKSGKIRVLVATDIAARGIDISELPHVINFDLPQVAEDYVHRIGRTGRAGATGEAISLVSADEVKQLAAIEKLIGKTLVREVEHGFVPVHQVPLTQHNVPAKTHKPKRRPANKPSKPGGEKPYKHRGQQDEREEGRQRQRSRRRSNTQRSGGSSSR